MEHRQFGYVFLIAIAAGAVASLNCGAPFSSCDDGACITTSAQAGAGGTTSSSSGTGGEVATGGGGSSTGGSPVGGSAPGGSGGAGGTGGQGGVVSPVFCGPDQVSIPTTGLVVCWHIDLGHDIPGTTLGLGGVIKEPGSPEIAQSVFPGCTTADPSQNTLVCSFDDLVVGTDFVFDPFATDGSSTYIRCDVPGLPTSQCFGEYWVFVDGIEVASFTHPPTGRWSYNDSGPRLRLVYTDPG